MSGGRVLVDEQWKILIEWRRSDQHDHVQRVALLRRYQLDAGVSGVSELVCRKGGSRDWIQKKGSNYPAGCQLRDGSYAPHQHDLKTR